MSNHPSATTDQMLLKVRRLAMEAEVFFEGDRAPATGPRLWRWASRQLPDSVCRLLRETCLELSGRRLAGEGMDFHFLDSDARRLVLRDSLTVYWYWRLARIASEHATSLPLTVDDVRYAIKHVRNSTSVPGIGSGSTLCQPLDRFSEDEIDALLLAGIVYREAPNELPKNNPLFLGTLERST